MLYCPYLRVPDKNSEVVLLHVIYQDVTESEVAYIGWGADTQLTQGKEITSHIYFFGK